jgi:catechol 2,3-dioxygenase-like lactoylglutathione lyase family enzyme
MLDHITFTVSDIAAARAFYDAALAPLGIAVRMEMTPEETGGPHILGYGDSRPFFWINDRSPETGRLHVAFAAATRAEVDAFHAAAMAAGGRDNGAPGPRPHYHPSYYGAFVLDPDGHNIEAVCHAPA